MRRFGEGSRSLLASMTSSIGPKRTFVFATRMSAFGGKADMAEASRNVRF
jgi:hypothetical protein